MSSVQIYIPRILGSVKKSEIRDIFIHMDIGTVKDIDMRYKMNENRHPYYYAFIDIQLFGTVRANTFKSSLNTHGMLRLLYDEEAAQYWEIRLHVEKKNRNNAPYINRTTVPFYRYCTLGGNVTKIQENTSPVEEISDYKEYNMWDTGFNILV